MAISGVSFNNDIYDIALILLKRDLEDLKRLPNYCIQNYRLYLNVASSLWILSTRVIP